MYCIAYKETFNHVVDFYWVVWPILQLTAHVQLGVDMEDVNKNGKKMLVLHRLLSEANERIL